jgi:ABC-2 type transport system permease protein
MPSKMSLFNKEMILQIGRSAGWISIVYTLGLLFTLPIKMLMMYSDSESDSNLVDYRKVTSLFQYDFTIQMGLIAVVPVLMALFLFRFLQVKQATDLMHSLPVKRERIFHYYVITGMMFLIVPVAIISLLILLIHSSLDLSSIFSIKDLLYWAGTTIVINLLLFTASVFVAMMTGISAVQAVLSYVFLFFPIGMMLLLFYNLKILLYGFPSDYFLNRNIEKMSPITYAAVLDGKSFHWNDAIVYILLTIIFYILALFFYKKRNLEAASEAIAFPKLRLIFKYGATFCTMLLGGAYFSDVPYTSFGWTLFGYAIGAVFGYYLAEMVLQKTWRVFAKVKGLLVYSAIIVVLVVAVQMLGIYENRLPVQSEIKNVLFTNNPMIFMNQNQIDGMYHTPLPMKDRNNIEAVRKFHQQILVDKKINQERKNDRSTNYFLLYELKNGQHVVREYRVNERLYEDFYKPIYQSQEYKLSTNEIFKLKENKIQTIDIRTNGPMNKMVTISNPTEIKEAISILKADVLAETYEDSVYFQNGVSSMDFYLGKDQFFNFEFKPTYLKFTEWLKEKNLFDQAKITADDLSHVLVAKVESTDRDDSKKIIRNVEESGNSLDVTAKEQIELLLNQTSSDINQEYKAVFYYKTGNYSDVYFFDEEHAPEFVKEHIK